MLMSLLFFYMVGVKIRFKNVKALMSAAIVDRFKVRFDIESSWDSITINMYLMFEIL